MKLINFTACLSQAKRHLQKHCSEHGYEVCPIEISENAVIEMLDEKHLKVSYATDDYETYVEMEIEPERLVVIGIEWVSWTEG